MWSTLQLPVNVRQCGCRRRWVIGPLLPPQLAGWSDTWAWINNEPLADPGQRSTSHWPASTLTRASSYKSTHTHQVQVCFSALLLLVLLFSFGPVLFMLLDFCDVTSRHVTHFVLGRVLHRCFIDSPHNDAIFDDISQSLPGYDFDVIQCYVPIWHDQSQKKQVRRTVFSPKPKIFPHCCLIPERGVHIFIVLFLAACHHLPGTSTVWRFPNDMRRDVPG